MKNTLVVSLMLLLVVTLVAGCGGPEQKKLKFYNKGEELYEQGDYVKANLEFKNAVQIDPKYADAFYMLGMVAFKMGDQRGAYGSYLKAVELSPNHKGAQVQLGWFLLSAAKINEAMEKTELVLQEDPKHEDALLLKTAILSKKKDQEGARRLLESVLGRDVKKPDGYLMLSSLYLQAGNAKSAEKILLDGITANEKAVSLYIALVDMYVKNKRADEAIGMMQKVIALEPDAAQPRIVLATIYWNAGKEQQAVEVLKTFVQADPKKEERWIAVANFYGARNKLVEMEQQLKEGISQNSKSFPIRFVLSAFYFSANRPEQGVAMLQECLGLDRDAGNPNVIHAKNSLAQYYLTRQEFDKAKQLADEVIKESPKNVDANYVAGTVLVGKQEGTQAVSHFRTVITERPQYIQGYIGLAEAHAVNKEYGLAFDTLQQAVKASAESRDITRARARIYAAQQDYKNAESQYRKLLSAEPRDLEVRADLGDLLLRSGDLKRAEAEYAEIKRRDPKQPISYVKLSGLFSMQKKWDRAINELEQAVKIHPELWSTTNDLAYMLCEYRGGEKDLDRALALVAKAKTLSSDTTAILDTEGWILYRKGDMNRAVEVLSQAQVKAPTVPVINYHLGMAYFRANNAGKAKEFLQLALASKANFPGKEEAEKTLVGLR
jgi:tetratricopeptide (TPR) repeat protein